MTARRFTRAEILDLPPAISLADLAACLGVSEPVVRVMNRTGQLEALGIQVNRWGAQHRVVTASVWRYLGLDAEPGASNEAPVPGGQGRSRPTASALRLASGGEAGPR